VFEGYNVKISENNGAVEIRLPHLDLQAQTSLIEELLFGPEMAEESKLGDAGLFRDLPRRSALIALFGHQDHCSIKDLLSGCDGLHGIRRM